MRKNGYVWLFGLLMSVMALGFSGCSDDDEPEISAELVGTWELTYGFYREKENGEVVEEYEYDDDHLIVFNADGTCYSDGETVHWSLKGGKLYMKYVEDGESYTESFPIKISSTEFIIEYTEKWKEDGDTYEYYEKMIYKKM